MIGITLIILIRIDRSHMQSKWIGITLVNCFLKIALIVYYTTVVHVMSGWVVTWFLLGYTVRKNGGLLSTPMFLAKVSRYFCVFFSSLHRKLYTIFQPPFFPI